MISPLVCRILLPLTGFRTLSTSLARTPHIRLLILRFLHVLGYAPFTAATLHVLPHCVRSRPWVYRYCATTGLRTSHPRVYRFRFRSLPHATHTAFICYCSHRSRLVPLRLARHNTVSAPLRSCSCRLRWIRSLPIARSLRWDPICVVDCVRYPVTTACRRLLLRMIVITFPDVTIPLR